MPTNREITVINKSDSGPPSLADQIEQWCKISAAVAIPVLLALIGYFVNARLQDQAVSQKYVEIATAILQKPIDATQDESQQRELRKWAVDLLKNSSPIVLPKDLPAAFVDGTVSLPESRPSAVADSTDPTTQPVVLSAYIQWSEDSYFRGRNFGPGPGQVFARVRVGYYDLDESSMSFIPISDESISKWTDTEITFSFSPTDKTRLEEARDRASQDLMGERASGFLIDYVITTSSGTKVVATHRRGALPSNE